MKAKARFDTVPILIIDRLPRSLLKSQVRLAESRFRSVNLDPSESQERRAKNVARFSKSLLFWRTAPMSWQVTSWVIENSEHKGSALLVMIMIANCANESGTDCWPSKERLARDTRLTPRHLARIIQQLEQSGEIEVRRSKGRLSNHYSFPLMRANPDKMSPLKLSPNPDISSLNPDIPASNPDIFSPNPDIAMSPDPSEEPSDRSVKIEPPYNGDRFLNTLQDFEQHRKEIKKPLQPTGRKQLYTQLGRMGELAATTAMQTSIANGWQGVFESNGSAQRGKPLTSGVTGPAPKVTTPPLPAGVRMWVCTSPNCDFEFLQKDSGRKNCPQCNSALKVKVNNK